MVKNIYISFFLFLVFQVGFTQKRSVLEKKSANFQAYQLDNYQERVYLHVDKRYYLAGEFVKFKVYCLERLTDRPSRLSKVAYVEILDRENSSHARARIELKNGTGTGEMYLPMNIASGNFVLRGYTRWMRNFSASDYFHAMLKIINPLKKPGLKPLSDTTFIEYFPEGGTLINGVETKVVFHGKSNLDVPLQVKAKLMANDSILVQEFSSIRNGIGHFSFKPDLMNRYHVEVKSGEGYVRLPFCSIDSRGLNVQVKQESGAQFISIFCNESSILQPNAKVSVLMHAKGRIMMEDEIQLNHGRGEMMFEKLNHPGVYSISFFDEAGNYLVERKLYHPSEEQTVSDIELDKGTYVNRERAELDLSGLSEYTSLSVSVSADHPYFSGNLLGLDKYLAIDNALKNVYQLEKYVEGSSEEQNQILNDLLIAYPVERNELIFADKPKTNRYTPEHRSVLVTAKVKNKQTGDPAFGILTYLSVPGKITQIYAAKSDLNGRLVFEAGNLFGSTQVILQTDYMQDSIYTIELDDPYSTEYADIIIPEFDLDENLADFLRRKSQQVQVFNANLKLSPQSITISSQDSSSFYINPDSRYYLDDYTRFVVMEEVMREYVSLVNVRKNRDGFHFRVVDIERDIIYEDNPLMLLDGVPIFDADEIIALDPLKIEKIETVKARFGRGVLDCKGIVTYTSYAGDLAGHQLNEDALVMDYDGLRADMEYLFPVYGSAVEKNNTTPDFRSNLFWFSTNPQLQENEILTFYTSDEADTYELRINAIGLDGKITSFNKHFKVINSIK